MLGHSWERMRQLSLQWPTCAYQQYKWITRHMRHYTMAMMLAMICLMFVHLPDTGSTQHRCAQASTAWILASCILVEELRRTHLGVLSQRHNTQWELLGGFFVGFPNPFCLRKFLGKNSGGSSGTENTKFGKIFGDDFQSPRPPKICPKTMNTQNPMPGRNKLDQTDHMPCTLSGAVQSKCEVYQLQVCLSDSPHLELPCWKLWRSQVALETEWVGPPLPIQKLATIPAWRQPPHLRRHLSNQHWLQLPNTLSVGGSMWREQNHKNKIKFSPNPVCNCSLQACAGRTCSHDYLLEMPSSSYLLMAWELWRSAETFRRSLAMQDCRHWKLLFAEGLPSRFTEHDSDARAKATTSWNSRSQITTASTQTNNYRFTVDQAPPPQVDQTAAHRRS